jgi:hypothetical protein
MRRFRFFVLLSFVACAAPLTIAEPREDGGAADASVDSPPPFGDRPDVDMDDQFASIQSEGGPAD